MNTNKRSRMTKRVTKLDLLQSHLSNGGSVTHATALVDFKIHNLTATLNDLRRRGFMTQAMRDFDGTGKPYTRWVKAATIH